MKPKRAISLLLAGCMAVSMVPASAVTAFAETVGSTPALAVLAQNAATNGHCGAEGQVESVSWRVEQNNTDAENPTYTLSIEGSGAIADYNVSDDRTEDDRPWKSFAGDITEVKIADGITRIGNSVFRGMNNLISANIPASVTSLGNYIFRNDGELTTVTWADGFTAHELVDVDSNAEEYRGAYVPTSMFDFCYKLGDGQELTEWLPKSFTGVGCGAFRDTKFTVNFDNWNNLKYIGAYAFYGMPNLSKFTLKDDIQIGIRRNMQGVESSCAFQKSGLKQLEVETEVLPKAFVGGCESLETIKLGDKIKVIGGSAFANAAIEEIDIPSNVEEIDAWAFYECKNLKKVTLHGNTKIVHVPFSGCGIEYFEIADGAQITCLDENPFRSQTTGGVSPAVTTLKKVIVFGSLESVKTGATTERLWKNMFGQNTQLKEVEVSAENLKYINADAFPGMEKLTVKGDSVELANANISATSLKTVDLSGCKKVTYATDFGTGVNNSAVIYVNDADASLPTEHSCVIMITNGGLVDENATGFDSVIRAGYTATWYEDAACTQKTEDATPQVGKTYYAKWSQNASMDAETDQKDDSQTATVTVGKPIEVTVTVNPGDNMLAILNGKARITFTDPTAVESLSCNGKTYTGKELADANYTLNVSDLIPGSDAGSGVATYAATTAYPSAKLSIVFNKKGNQTVKIQLLDSDSNLLCESKTVVAVEEEKKPEETKPDDTKPENPVTTYALTVKGGTVKVNDKDAVANNGVIAVEKDATVDVTFDKSTLSDAQVFDLWSITPDSVLNAVDPHTETIRFTMPAEKVTIEAMTRDATIESEGPGVLGTAALIGVAGAGAAVVGYQGYMIGTELYLNTVLPDGVAIPQNTAELAKLVWTEAGKPAPAAVMAPDATDEQKALTWAIENQLISADKAADASVSRWEVIQTWNKAQEMKG